MNIKEIQSVLDRATNCIQKIAPRRPSYFTLEHMLVGKEVTHQAKLQRIMEEIRSKVQEIEGSRDQVADSLDQHRLMQLEVEGKFPPGKEFSEYERIQKRMALRRIDAMGRQIASLREVTASRCEEVIFLIGLFEKLAAQEGPQDWDNPDVQRKFYEAKLGQDIAIRHQLGMKPDMEVVRAVLSLPPESDLKKILEGQMGRRTVEVKSIER